MLSWTKCVKSIASKIHLKFVPREFCVHHLDNRRLFLISSPAVQGYQLYEYVRKDLTDFLQRHKVKKILFIPYAMPDQDYYFNKQQMIFTRWGYELYSIHKFTNPIQAIKDAPAIFIGGGNTFLLLNNLYKHSLLQSIRRRVIADNIPLIGCSAGSNVATPSIHTTNDMPIIYPPSLKALDLVPFNINPHYQDADPRSMHRSETRQERIEQYLNLSGKPVLAMREGCHLIVENGCCTLKGIKSAVLFYKNIDPIEITPDSTLNYLFLKNKSLYEAKKYPHKKQKKAHSVYKQEITHAKPESVCVYRTRKRIQYYQFRT